ncbi:unnamed protein product [Porites evermanni]|uniref:Uncharacterized protein n=1 Tax=Porites evermanni TaxID=104178 RepID=A0ABN8PSN6_9CNID|nr:unnamed protein product [Porites evermanni]CAH3166865.1 unnamed protein product [Porites evermanni]
MAKKSQIDEKKSQIISRRKSFVFCDDHGIFRTHEINTSLPSIFGPFQLIATKCGGHVFPKTLVRMKGEHVIDDTGDAKDTGAKGKCNSAEENLK